MVVPLDLLLRVLTLAAYESDYDGRDLTDADVALLRSVAVRAGTDPDLIQQAAVALGFVKGPGPEWGNRG